MWLSVVCFAVIDLLGRLRWNTPNLIGTEQLTFAEPLLLLLLNTQSWVNIGVLTHIINAQSVTRFLAIEKRHRIDAAAFEISRRNVIIMQLDRHCRIPSPFLKMDKFLNENSYYKLLWLHCLRNELHFVISSNDQQIIYSLRSVWQPMTQMFTMNGIWIGI